MKLAVGVLPLVALLGCSAKALDLGGEVPDGGQDVSSGSTSAPGIATFELLVDGVVQTPLTCPHTKWEFAPFPAAFANQAAIASPGQVGCGGPAMCSGVTSVILKNTGPTPVAFIAASFWNLPGHYQPGVSTGDPNQLVGVLAPGAGQDITSVYNGGIAALLGSSDPFSASDEHVADEGTIPWPAGVDESHGTTEMSVALIEVSTICTPDASPVW